MQKNGHSWMIFAGLGLIVMTGTYNAVMINSHSSLQDMKFVKRLDETLGVTIQGRSVAAAVNWQKVVSKKSLKKIIPENEVDHSSQSETVTTITESTQPDEATVKDDLNLMLVEVINQKKWPNGLPQNQFSGSVETNQGIIQSLAVSLPNDEGLSVSFSEMTGNVFEYDLNGETQAGMMYQVDEHSYMVALTSGPLEGTRFRFSSQEPAATQQDVQDTLAQNNVEVNTFGEMPVEEQRLEDQVSNETPVAQETAQNLGFNFGAETM